MGEKSVGRVAKFKLMRRFRPTYLLISGAENLYKKIYVLTKWNLPVIRLTLKP